MIPLSTYMTTYKVGDYVDIKANGACQKGMPYRFYHGKTGVIFNVGLRSVGVLVHKQVRSRFEEKRIVVRVEHVKPSKCRDEFLARSRANSQAKASGDKSGVATKRMPALPRPAHVIEAAENVPVLLAPVPYEILI
jgi:large subunit ribosomal protein L21e